MVAETPPRQLEEVTASPPEPAEAVSPQTASPEPDQPGRARASRRFLAPEVIQTSAMDCGPAALKCLLEGFGVPVSYGRLREACQTSVDGTSIDTLETVATLLGLQAEQVMVPVEHVAAPSAQLLPAIAVVRLPGGSTHFVVLWRQLGPYLQLMDPARGRRWVRTSAFLRELHVHAQPVAADAFSAFVTDAGFTTPLEWRIAQLVGPTQASRDWKSMVRAAAAATRDPAPPGSAIRPGAWEAVGRLDGATRAVQSLVDAGTVRRGSEAAVLLRALLSRADTALAALVAGHSCARSLPPDPDGSDQVEFTGAVLVRIAGARAAQGPAGGTAEDRAAAPLPPELAAALDEKPTSAWRALLALWDAKARRLALLAAALVPVVAVGVVAELFLARPLLAAGDAAQSSARQDLLRGFVVLLGVVATVWAIEMPMAGATRRLGRALDQGLRRAFLRKLPLLGDRYFSSRPVSDMAERAHLLHRVRLLPSLAAQLGRCWFELLLATAAIIWLYPQGAVIALALFAFSCLVPLLASGALAERDQRLRAHSGSLMRFYVDALLGLSAIRTHGAERAVMREQASRLGEWRRAGGDMVRAALTVEATVVLIATAGAGVLVIGYLESQAPQALTGAGPSAAGLLLLFFALGIPMQAARLCGLWRQLPDHRNVTLRLMEPLGAPEERRANRQEASPGGDAAGAVEIALDGVCAEAGGHPVLSDVSVAIQRGSHVAVVGASGAGKSTLIGLMLGFHVPVSGRVLVDGVDLHGDSDALALLRRQTVWVEPGVQLWNRSLAENVAYGADPAAPDDEIARALAAAELSELVARLPDREQTTLGEGGGLLSGGEGQRVRLARELVRVPRPRLILLDEPFRGLDGETRRRLFADARQRWAGVTMIAATHDVEHTRTFSRVLVIADGRIVEDGVPTTLASDSSSHYSALLDADKNVRAERWAGSRWRRLLVRGADVVPNNS